jgi:hypothetical protein
VVSFRCFSIGCDFYELNGKRGDGMAERKSNLRKDSDWYCANLRRLGSLLFGLIF